ncbi:hypothetical protein O3P69_005425 [Scylla paramamosain]|uniref:Uncharacterized protein n=1 Tax=Scylla paramamosain TaxID=85552 RepID=A0AAW0U8J6_SCYPA
MPASSQCPDQCHSRPGMPPVLRSECHKECRLLQWCQECSEVWACGRVVDALPGVWREDVEGKQKEGGGKSEGKMKGRGREIRKTCSGDLRQTDMRAGGQGTHGGTQGDTGGHRGTEGRAGGADK